MPSLFEYAGGEPALHRLEQHFYDSVLTDLSSSRSSAPAGPSTSTT